MMKLLQSISFLYMLLQGAGINAQNVGIGTATPGVPLDIKSISNAHLLRLDGTSSMFMSIYENGIYRGYLGSYSGNAEDVDFGTGAGNSTGKLHLTTQANPRLTIRENGYVGIGNTNPQWQLDVEGGLRFNGRLYVNGSSGTSGQVLTSNFLSPPSWQTLSFPFDNPTRFEASFIESSNTLLTPPLEYTEYLNTSPADVTITASSITINKSGLYHIEGYSEYSVVFNNIPSLFAQKFLCTIDGRSFIESNKENVPRDPQFTTPAYTNFGRFSHEVYVTAPGTISFGYPNS